jgi:S-DNA-T family DNA segregation ATPase FtsK/SpoIIIE
MKESDDINEIAQQIEELTEAVRALSEKQDSQYAEAMVLLKSIAEKFSKSQAEMVLDDEIYEDAKEAVIDAGAASTSYLQRALGIGYARAARLMDQLEEEGVIGKAHGAKPRKVLVAADSR